MLLRDFLCVNFDGTRVGKKVDDTKLNLTITVQITVLTVYALFLASLENQAE
jgi:hypothetical protein